ncbi:MAG TPA: bifunctional helix-turn-helix transcriptional regulator/GNAT family N-acetyltransferase [bacterium]|nr:bifunctional helix-turn-helix transcriptional regulator/GNAT family N-acetyltransferase [bacterium]
MRRKHHGLRTRPTRLPPNNDLIGRLGPLALATRLRRLSETLYKDGPRIYSGRGVDFEPRWFSLYYLLLESDAPVTVSLAARALGQKHPAIVQTAREMSEHGLLISVTDSKDRRRTLLRLTVRGRRLLARLRPVWADIEAVAGELVAGTSGNFLDQITQIEAALSAAGVYERIAKRVKARQLGQVEIVSYRPSLKRHFASLNREWLREYYRVEEVDREVFQDPYATIIGPGGCILFARLAGRIVGTVALVKRPERTFELTKMAVTGPMRGRQVGRRLAAAAIGRARSMGARQIVLFTSRRLTAAYRLYRSLGFAEVPDMQPWAGHYERESLGMVLGLGSDRLCRKRNAS